MKLTGKEIKEAVEWLMTEKQGCWSKCMLIDDDDNHWCVVIGWGEGFDEKDNLKYQDGQWAICSKIAKNDSSLQCDYQFDFTMPYDEKSGDVCDTDNYIGEPDSMAGWNRVAKDLLKTFEDVTKEWAVFCNKE